jgi:hypothetical protein
MYLNELNYVHTYLKKKLNMLAEITYINISIFVYFSTNSFIIWSFLNLILCKFLQIPKEEDTMKQEYSLLKRGRSIPKSTTILNNKTQKGTQIILVN